MRRVVLVVAASLSCTRPNPLFMIGEDTVAGSQGDASTGDPGDGPGETDSDGPDDPTGTAAATGPSSDDTCGADCLDPDQACVQNYTCTGSLDWLVRSGDAGEQQASDAAVLSDGSVIVVGSFSGQLGSDPNVISAADDPAAGDAFIMRYTAAGELAWIRQIGGAGLQRANAVAVLPGDVIAVAGTFSGQLVIEPHVIDNVAARPAFLAIFDTAGESSTIHIFNGDDVDALDVGAGPDGDFVVAGRFAGDILLFGDKHTSDGDDLFVVRADIDSGSAWHFVSLAPGDQMAAAVASSPAGVLIAGAFTDSLTIGSTKLNAQGVDGFLAGFDPDGTPQRAARIGGAGDDRVRALAVAPDGSHVIAGVHNGIDLGGVLPDGPGPLDGFLAAYDPAGALQWARGDFAFSRDNPGLAVDPAGHIIASLPVDATPVDFGLGVLNGTAGVLLVKLTQTGEFAWGRHLAGSAAPLGTGLGVGPSGEIAVAGAFDLTLTLGTTTLQSTGARDVFAGRFLP